MTSKTLTRWIKSLSRTKRAKEQYPVCIRQIFKAAMLEFNGYDNDVMIIKNNPWMVVKIPKADTAEKRAISAEECRKFFSVPLPPSVMANPLEDLGRDVARMIICMGGINTVDLYNMKKRNFRGGKLCYNRAKTQGARRDNAYMEMWVEPMMFALFDKYAAPADDPYFFSFHNRYANYNSFDSNVNSGIKKICKFLGFPKDDQYCVYTFRHTWATIAQNDCDASVSDVAFGLNHSHGHA